MQYDEFCSIQSLWTRFFGSSKNYSDSIIPAVKDFGKEITSITIDSPLSCVAAAEAVKNREVDRISFKFRSYEEIDLPSVSLNEILSYSKEKCTISFSCSDFFYHHRAVMKKMMELFELIKKHS